MTTTQETLRAGAQAWRDYLAEQAEDARFAWRLRGPHDDYPKMPYRQQFVDEIDIGVALLDQLLAALSETPTTNNPPVVLHKFIDSTVPEWRDKLTSETPTTPPPSPLSPPPETGHEQMPLQPIGDTPGETYARTIETIKEDLGQFPTVDSPLRITHVEKV